MNVEQDMRAGGTVVAAVAVVRSVAACSRRRVRAATLGRRPRATPAAASGPSASAVAAHDPVTITVGVLRPGATQEAVDALNLQITEFEAKYPWITVEPQEYNWTAPTFTAALAAERCRTSSRSRSRTARA